MVYGPGVAEAGVFGRGTEWRGVEAARAVAAGLPAYAVDALSERVAPGDAAFKYRLVPKATLARRRGGSLSAAEGERVMRLARVFDFAVKVTGDEDGARHFLFGPHMLLNQAWAIDLVLEGETGAEAVLGVLGRAYYGVAI